MHLFIYSRNSAMPSLGLERFTRTIYIGRSGPPGSRILSTVGRKIRYRFPSSKLSTRHVWEVTPYGIRGRSDSRLMLETSGLVLCARRHVHSIYVWTVCIYTIGLRCVDISTDAPRTLNFNCSLSRLFSQRESQVFILLPLLQKFETNAFSAWGMIDNDSLYLEEFFARNQILSIIRVARVRNDGSLLIQLYVNFIEESKVVQLASSGD